MEYVSKERWIYLDVCKIIAVLFYVVMHVAASAWTSVPIDTTDWQVLNVFNCLSRICIPLFFMQIGAALINESSEVSNKVLFKKTILPVITAVIFWATLRTLRYYYFDSANGFADITVVDFVERFISSTSWFVYVAIGLLMVVPILREIGRNHKATRYFIVLWVLFAVILPVLYKIPYLFSDFPAAINLGISWVTSISEKIKPALVLQYSGYMLLGHYIHTHTFSKSGKNLAAFFAVLGFALTLFLTIHLSFRYNKPMEDYIGNFSPGVCLMSGAMMVVLKVKLQEKWYGNFSYKSIRFFSDASFGIFLMHDFLRILLVRFGITTMSFTPILSVPALSLGLFVACAIVVFIIRKIPGLGKYLA